MRSRPPPLPRHITSLLAALLLAASGALGAQVRWDAPLALSGAGGKYPQLAEGKDFIAAAWQEASLSDDGYGSISIKVSVARLGAQGAVSWGPSQTVGRPIRFLGLEPNAFWLCAGPERQILIACLDDEAGINVLFSPDEGGSWTEARLPEPLEGSVDPRVFRSSRGYLLLMNRSFEESTLQEGGIETLSFSRDIVASISKDGLQWSEFTPVISAEEGLSQSQNPVAVPSGSSDLLAFQSLLSAEDEEGRASYQLWLKKSTDGGSRWSAATRLTTDQEGEEGLGFTNQRPSLAASGSRILLAWQRSLLVERGSGAEPAQIWAMELDSSGLPSGEAVQISSDRSGAVQAQAFYLQGGKAGVLWTAGTGRPQASVKDAIGWADYSLGTTASQASFSRQANLGSAPCFVWQRGSSSSVRVYALSPDRSVKPPLLRPLNFTEGKALSRSLAEVSWEAPQDPSGISGFSVSWSQDPKAKPPSPPLPPIPATSTRQSLPADSDGPWYFSVRAMDEAGNWSEPATLTFLRDTRAPEPPKIIPPELDGEGALASNSFSLGWEPQGEGDIAGYTWNLRRATEGPVPEPGYPRRILGTQREASWANIENGRWLFELAAIDQAGNISAPARLELRATRFIPFTLVSYVDASQDEAGALRLRVFGRGFTDEGLVQSLILDADGKEPYDRVFDRSAGDFRVAGNGLIDGLGVADLLAGSYRLLIIHPARGLYRAPMPIRVAQGGTVKYGDGPWSWREEWKPASGRVAARSPWLALSAFIFLLSALSVLVLGRRIKFVIDDTRLLKAEVIALIEGGSMPTTGDKRRLRDLARRGTGLRLKFSIFIMALVIPIVVMVALPLSLYSLDRQSLQQATSLRERAGVLMESLASSAKVNLPLEGALALSDAMGQVSAMPGEALHAIITGLGPSNTNPETVWASSLSTIGSSPEREGGPSVDGESLLIGRSILTDALSPQIASIISRLEEAGSQAELASLRRILDDTQNELAQAARARDIERQLELDERRILYEKELNARLAQIAEEASGSVPAFDPRSIGTGPEDYLFYKPVLSYRSGFQDYYLGMVRLSVTTKVIRSQISALRTGLLSIAMGIAAVSILLGLGGAIFFATSMTAPIKRLVKAFETVRDTARKERLANLRVDLSSRDELRTLSDTFNTMVKGLVHGAKDNADLLAGEQDQRELLPLESDERRRKLAVGKLETKDLEFFAYYKGAKLVSGDYVDYRSLDARHYSFIKCDVSGKGVSAAMIMAIVASVFKQFFEDWTPAKPGFDLPALCYRINGTLNACEFRGKFAAFTVGIYDSQTGKAWLCHAGDSQYRVYDSRQRKLVTHRMPGEAPAAGPIANFMVEAKTPFVQTIHMLEPGDILVLFSDGIDESRRYWRNPDFSRVQRKGGAERAKSAEHAGEMEEYAYEDFSNDRAAAVFEAAIERGKYRMLRDHDPVEGMSLDFDYSACTGSLEDGVMALVSAEKAFRMYRPPEAQDDDQVKIDVKIDDFLRKTFQQYFEWCSLKTDNPEEKEELEEIAERARSHSGALEAAGSASHPGPSIQAKPHYLMYQRLMEDEQYDDITVLCLRRK